jgi:hypothetical protein
LSGKRKTDAQKKRLKILENQKKQLQQKIDKRTANLQSGKKIGIEVGKLEKTEKRESRKTKKENERKSLEYEVEGTEYQLGLKEEIIQHLRRTLGIVDGDLSKAKRRDLYNYKHWLEKNGELTIREKARDTIIRKEVLRNLGVKEFDKLGFFTKMALPTAKVIERFGGGPGKIVSEKLYGHFYDTMTTKATGNYYRRTMTQKFTLKIV